MNGVLFKVETVTSLPESGAKSVLYIVGDTEPRALYFWNGSAFVHIGSEDSITIDSELSTTSENPVQNKVITAALNNKADSSSVPTDTGDLTNGAGFITANDLPTIDSALSDSSENAVQNKVVKAAIDAKQNNLVFTGTYDNIAISSLLTEGFYYVTNPTDAPTGIGKCIVEVTRAIQNAVGGTGVFVHQIVTGTRGDHDQLINNRYERYVRKMPSASSYTVGRWFRVLVEENTNDMLTELGIPWTNGNGIDFTTEAYGHITGQRKYLHLMIPIDKIILDTITASDITSLVISIRHPSGGYIISDGAELVGMTGITIGNPTICLNCLRIIIQSTTDLYTTNNIPVTGQVTIKTAL